MLFQERREPVDSELRQESSNVEHQVAVPVLAAVLGQPGSEREERDDFAPRDDVADEKLLRELVEAELEVRVPVDLQPVHHAVEDDGVTVEHFRHTVTKAATDVIAWSMKS